MNIQDGGELQKLLQFLLETLQQGKDFTLEQAPKFVQELLWWRFWEAAFWCGIGVFLVAGGFLAARALVRMMAANGSEEGDLTVARYLVRAAGIALGFLFIGTNIHTMVQVKVAPRVVLVEMARDMLAPRR